MARSRKPPEAGKKLIGFYVYETIGIGIVNSAALRPRCPEGCIRVWDEQVLDDGKDWDEASVWGQGR